MNKNKTIILLALSVMMLLASCNTYTAPELSLSRDSYIDSDVFVLYYPYKRKSNAYTLSNPKLKNGFRPVAEHDTWHNERMDNDLRDMISASIDGVFLCISPIDMADKNKREMIGHFLEKCSQLQFKVVFCLASDTPLSLRWDNVINYIQDRHWDTSQSLYEIDGKIPLVFNEAISIAFNGDDTRFTPLSLDISKGKFADALPSPFCVAKSAGAPDTIVADRSMAAYLIDSINEALDLNKGRILIFSWNLYADGTAIEKNTFDYNTQLKALQ